jgi:DNA-binding response OmpR family regulator
MKPDTDTPSEFTVLLVDDDDRFRTQLAEYLRAEDFEIVETNCSSGASALVREAKISLVLLDWDLHKGNSSPEDLSTGLEVVRTCREINPLLPVIAMSGAPGLDARTDSMMAGADCFLQKTFALELLSTLLRRWMARVKAERNPFTQLTAGVIETADAVNRAYTRAVVERVGSALQAAPKLGLSRQTIASYLASPDSS